MKHQQREKKANFWTVLRAMFQLLKPHKLALAEVLPCLIVLTLLNLLVPKISGYVIDHVFGIKGPVAATAEERLRLLGWVLAAILGVYVLRNLLFYRAKTRMTAVGEHAAFDLRQRLIQHLHTLSVDFYQQNKPGKISARVMQDVQAIKQFLQEELSSMLLNVLMLIGVGAIMLHTNPFLAALTLLLLPLHVLALVAFSRPIARYAREAKERIADLSGDLIEQLDGVATVKASATQLIEQERLRRAMRRGMRAQIKQDQYYTLQKVATDLLIGVGLIVLFGVGGHAVVRGKMSPGDFVAFLFFVNLLNPRLLELVSQAGKLSHTGTSLERVQEILDIEPGVKEKPDAIPHEVSRGRIEFRNVCFSYQNGQVLKDVSFVVEPGEHVLITGPSGAGKSTLVNLIPRFFDPSHGQILIDGIDVRDFTLTSLRRQIGFVFQDCFLFNDTVMNNIRYAWPEAGDAEVIHAARRAFAHEFIERLPEGYQTVVGEGGVQFSQGQKRRLMIARAILKNPRILILDEPLVSLDPEARKEVIAGLTSLFQGRTVLNITHYPAELPQADKVIHLSGGRALVRSLKKHMPSPAQPA